MKVIFTSKNWVWSELVFELGVEWHISSVDIQSNKYISLDDLENLIANLMEAFGESLIDLSSQVNLNL